MRYVHLLARVLLGLVFFVFGLNGFLHFIPQPKDAMTAEAQDFFSALVRTHYMIPLIFSTQTAAGVLLLLNRFVPLALVLLAPILTNIILFHLYLAPGGLPMATVVAALEIYLVILHHDAWRGVLVFKAKASAGR